MIRTLKRTTLVPLFVAALSVASCSSGVDGFKDEETKRLAWDVMSCTAYGRVSAKVEGFDVTRDLVANRVPPSEREEAKWWADRLMGAETVDDVMQYESGDGYSNMCSGWLWERHKKESRYMQGYDEFTFEKAEEAEVFE